MKIHRNVEQRSDEWFKLREKRMTASNALAIATNGKGLKTYIYQLMSDYYKIDKSEDRYISKDMQKGIDLEPEAAQIYSFETGNKIEKIGFVEYNEYVGCSPDLFAGKNGLTEIKCLNDKNHYRVMMEEDIENKYIFQCQMQMLVCEKKWSDLFFYNTNLRKSYHRIRIEYDQDIANNLLAGFKKGEALIKKLTKKSEGMNL